MSESLIQSQVRLEASKRGWRVFRNNVGAGRLENGSWIRWGLCNETPALNAKIKSADLIGIRPVLITPDMVGRVIGQFVSRECKRPGWKFNPNDKRDVAQAAWARIINDLGGDAKITTGEL